MNTVCLLSHYQEQHVPQINEVLRRELHSEVALIRTVAEYIINSGGKRIRPILLLICAEIGGSLPPNGYLLATIVELIHTATLLHDDVVDSSSLRRGNPTANAIFGNPASVLVGDFLYSRAFQLMVRTHEPQVLAILADATNIIAEGEVLQLLESGNINLDEKTYFRVLYSKTAKLFEASAQLGAVASQLGSQLQKDLATYGVRLGTAFQLIDDILDYTGNPQNIGKNLGDDLNEGKITLPLLRALAVGNSHEKILIQSTIQNPAPKFDQNRLADILTILHRTKALTYARMKAEEQIEAAKTAITSLPSCTSKELLLSLLALAIEREN